MTRISEKWFLHNMFDLEDEDLWLHVEFWTLGGVGKHVDYMLPIHRLMIRRIVQEIKWCYHDHDHHKHDNHDHWPVHHSQWSGQHLQLCAREKERKQPTTCNRICWSGKCYLDVDHDDDCQKDTDDKNTEPAICPSPCPFEVVHHVSGAQVVKLQNIFLMTEMRLG